MFGDGMTESVTGRTSTIDRAGSLLGHTLRTSVAAGTQRCCGVVDSEANAIQPVHDTIMQHRVHANIRWTPPQIEHCLQVPKSRFRSPVHAFANLAHVSSCTQRRKWSPRRPSLLRCARGPYAGTRRVFTLLGRLSSASNARFGVICHPASMFPVR